MKRARELRRYDEVARVCRGEGMTQRGREAKVVRDGGVREGRRRTSWCMWAGMPSLSTIHGYLR